MLIRQVRTKGGVLRVKIVLVFLFCCSKETLNIEIPFKKILRETLQKLKMLPPIFSTENDCPDNAKRFHGYLEVFDSRFNNFFVGP